MPENFHRFGQSNQAFINLDTASAPNQALNTLWLPLMNALVGSISAGNIFAVGVVGSTLGTAIGGIGIIGRNTSGSPPLVLQADGYHGVIGGEHWVRPAPPTDPAKFDNWATWPLTAAGENVRDYVAGLSAAAKADLKAIGVLLNEGDVGGFPHQTAWSRNDPRVWAYGLLRMVNEIRTQAGKTPAQCPVTVMAPIPYSPGGPAAYEVIWRGFNIAARMAGQNVHIAYGNCMDVVLDRNDGSGGDDGGYRFHLNKADQLYLARKLAFAEAAAVGRHLNPAAPVWAGRGPEIVWVRWVDDTTLDVHVRHDGGTTLTLPATATRGWRVEYAGRPITVSAAAVVSSNRVRLTVTPACPVPELVRVHYGWGSARLIEGGTGSHGTGGIYDNAATWDSKAMPASLTGADRVNMTLRRTQPGGLRATAAAPPASLLLPE